ncbi:hypothetical protein EBBID32_12590 [Sphingobium indicum BiD32]|uniref:Uncharacterized protein n=1 Tax=Sphingobium indicum BiD32 TaxID=1301087 RepID=N1MI65_9SPHN|nr:hypothetical protein EBBID32_12590 [Sphingobium indicum BiD32]
MAAPAPNSGVAEGGNEDGMLEFLRNGIARCSVSKSSVLDGLIVRAWRF